jgi:hypothetical protein
MQRLRRAIGRFWQKGYEDGLTGLAAMVAYNLLLSLFPVALIALFIAGRVLQSDDITRSVLDDLQKLFPSATESDLRSALRSVRSSTGTVGILALVGSAWVASSFWGALDTAFCRIYHLPCRSWVRQKVFALGMLVVVLVFFAASVAIPALQSLWVSSRARPPTRPRPRPRARLCGVADRQPRAAVRDAVPDLLARPEGRDPVDLRVARRARLDRRDGGRRLAVPALPGRGEHAAHRCRGSSCSC